MAGTLVHPHLHNRITFIIVYKRLPYSNSLIITVTEMNNHNTHFEGVKPKAF